MRILLVADLAGGVWTFVRELAAELSARGVELHLALLGSDEPVGVQAMGAASWQRRDLRLEWMEDPWADVEAAGDWIEQLCARHRPDVIHMNTFSPVRCPGMPVLLTAHSCVLTWWRAVHAAPAPASWDRYRALVAGALERADAVAVPTRALLEELRAVYGTLPPTRVIPNGRTVVCDAADARERLVVSVGRLWDEAKNVRLVVRAAPQIRGEVVLIGPGEVHEARYLRLAGQLGEADVLGWLCRAAVFAEPARYEPFGLAALEAALSGCALVLGDIASLREVWRDAATYVSPDDPRELADAVNALLDDPARLSAGVRKAGAAAARYAPSAMAEAYLDAYRAVTRERDRFAGNSAAFSSRSPGEAAA